MGLLAISVFISLSIFFGRFALVTNANSSTSKRKIAGIIAVIMFSLAVCAFMATMVYAADGFVINKVDDNGDPVEGAVFDVDGKPVVTFEEIPDDTPETTTVTVTKKWDDSSDKDGVRPDKIELILYRGGEPIASHEINAKDSDSQTYTFTKDSDGNDLLAMSESKTLSFTPGSEAQEVELPGEGTYTIAMTAITKGDLKPEDNLLALTDSTGGNPMPLIIDTVSATVTVDEDGNCTVDNTTCTSFAFGIDGNSNFIYNDIEALKEAYLGTGADTKLNTLNPHLTDAGASASGDTVTLTTVISQGWEDDTGVVVK